MEAVMSLNIKNGAVERLVEEVARLLAEASVTVAPFGESHYSSAVDAWLRYGKGRHPASLNFGDCLSCAVARLAGEPLVVVGDDFTRTDTALP
jgi:ribonuclease VapC